MLTLLMVNLGVFGDSLAIKILGIILTCTEVLTCVIKFIKLFTKKGSDFDKTLDKLLDLLGERKTQVIQAQQDVKNVTPEKSNTVVERYGGKNTCLKSDPPGTRQT